jgi:hypothetical protein
MNTLLVSERLLGVSFFGVTNKVIHHPPTMILSEGTLEESNVLVHFCLQNLLKRFCRETVVQ